MPAFLILVLLGADAPKPNFKDDVAPIFQNRCNSCHNGDKQKGGLALETYSSTMKGGGSGTVVEPGDSGSSRLFALVSHAEEPKMPPMQPKMPDAELNTIKAWIDGGALEASGAASAMKAKPKLDFKLDPSAIGKPAGPPAMPEGVSTDPVVVSARPNAILALATSPWAPLMAVSGHKQVLLYRTDDRKLVAVLPFPEGTIHSLKFSRDGGLLLAGGGRGGQSGRVVAWDVKTGKRLFEIGREKEFDVVLAADISPDRSMVVVGGPNKLMRVYNTADGEVAYESKKHTDWVTAAEFSPDGVLLATGDRNGGLVVWEAATGREFYDLRNHQAAISDVSWRLDSNLLASGSEDTTIRLWEMQNGSQVKGWGAHGGGVTSVEFAKDGRLASTGRDKTTRLWDQNGGQKLAFEAFPDLALRAAFPADDASVVSGDWSGLIRAFDLKDAKKLGELAANPAPLAVRLEQARQALAAVQGAADAANRDLQPLQSDLDAKSAALAGAEKALADAKKAEADAAAPLAQAEQALKAATEAEKVAVEKDKAARETESALTAKKAEIDKALTPRLEASLATSAKALSSGNPQDRQAAEQAVAALSAAVKEAETLLPRAIEATLAARASKPLAEQATAARVAAEAPIPALRAALEPLRKAVPPLQAARDASANAKTEAEKVFAARAPALKDVIAKAAAIKAEVDALAAEKPRSPEDALGMVKP